MAREPKRPHLTAETEKEAASRRTRLAEQLRTNLARRKAQIRAREDEGGTPPRDGRGTP